MPETLPPEIRDTLQAIAGHLGRIDGRLSAVEASVASLGKDVVALGKEVAEVKGKVSQMPTAFQLFLGVFAIMAASMGGISLILANAGRITGHG